MTSRVFNDAVALSEAAAVHVARAIAAKTGDFHLVLSGGSTPERLYRILASPAFRDDVDWSRVHFWWGDERFVPPTDPQSNERMARAAMLDSLAIAPDRVHAMFRGGTATDAAAAYEEELRQVLGDNQLDLVLLGIGPDGHTASLFPHDPSLDEAVRWVVPSTGAAGIAQRITMTAPILNAAHEVLFLVAGADKAEPLKEILNGAENYHQFPAQIVARNAPNVTWFLDEAAAARL